MRSCAPEGVLECIDMAELSAACLAFPSLDLQQVTRMLGSTTICEQIELTFACVSSSRQDTAKNFGQLLQAQQVQQTTKHSATQSGRALGRRRGQKSRRAWTANARALTVRIQTRALLASSRWGA